MLTSADLCWALCRYYHQFLISQPDLNWRNPDLLDAMQNVLRFWLRRGVSGFRMDAFAYLFEGTALVQYCPSTALALLKCYTSTAPGIPP